MDLAGLRSSRQECASSAIDESSQHVTDVILSAEKHRQDAYDLPFFVNIKPVDCAMDRQMPQSRQNFVVTFTSVRRGQNAISGCANFQNPCFGMFDRNLHTFAKADVAFEEMVENQLEITFRLRRKLKTKRHGCVAFRRLSCSADRPFLPLR